MATKNMIEKTRHNHERYACIRINYQSACESLYAVSPWLLVESPHTSSLPESWNKAS